MTPTDDLPEELVGVANQLRGVRDEPPLEPANPELLDRIHATLGDELNAPTDSSTPAATGTAATGPGVAASVARPRRTTPKLRRRSLLIGGAAGVAIGAAGVAVGTRVAGRVNVIAKATLKALTEAAPELGTAELRKSRRGLELDIRTNDPIDFPDGFLEVWLLNSDGQRLLSVGLFRPGDRETYPIDQAVYDAGFVIVDISRQRYDEGLNHSGNSVMRGALKPE